MVRFLVEACGADVEAARVDRVTGAGETVLSMACAAGATEVVRFLLGSGARADRRLPSARGIGSGSGGSGSGTGAAAAVAAVTTTTTTPLLTGRGQTALHVAVLADRPECVEVLLREGGADANAVFDAAGPDVDTAGRGFGLERGLRSLRDRGRGRARGRGGGGGSREETRKGEKAEKEKAPKHPVSALHLAAHASPECARLLLEHGARVDIRDAYGRTPLHWAAEAGHGAVVRLLVEAGANINAELPVARPGSKYCGQDLGWFGKETYEALNESG
ncbi:ankyrin [Thermothelomyces heterothallicus CBS 203.75]